MFMTQKTNRKILKTELSIFRFSKEMTDPIFPVFLKKSSGTMKMIRRSIFFLVFILSSFAALSGVADELNEPMRTWTSQKGKTVQGVWLPEKDSSDGNTVFILKKNGKVGRVKVSALSPADAQYIRNRQALRRRQNSGETDEIVLDDGSLQDLSTPSVSPVPFGPIRSPQQFYGSSAVPMQPQIGIEKYSEFSELEERECLELIREFGRTGKKEILKTHTSQKVDERRYLFTTAKWYKNLYDTLDIKNPNEDALRMIICDRVEAFRMRFSQFTDCAAETEWLTYFESSILLADEFLQKLGNAIAVRDQKLRECRTIGEREKLNAVHEEYVNTLTDEFLQKLTPLNESMLALEDQLVRKYGYVTYSPAASSMALNIDAAISNEDIYVLFDYCLNEFRDSVVIQWENKNKSKALASPSNNEADLEKVIAYYCYLASLIPEHSMYDIDRGVILKGIMDSLVAYRVFESENFDLDFAIECSKFTLAYFTDNTGECRFGLMAILQAEGEFDMAIELARELMDIYKGNYFYALRSASLCVEKKDYERAFIWFEAAISVGALCEYVPTMQAGEPVYHADFALIRPDVFCELQRQDPERFANILRPSLSWDHRLGNEYDIFQIANHSPFPVHNVKFKVIFSDGNRTWTRTYYTDRIEAGDVLTGDTTDGNHCAVRYPTSTSAEITCDENVQR